MLLKTAGQQRVVAIIELDGRLFGNSWVRLCATEPIQRACAHCYAHDFLQRRRCAIAIGVCAPLWWALVAKNRFRFVPRKRKRPVRTSGPKRELEARRGTGPHTRRGCTVLHLGRCTGTYCFGVAGKLGRGPRVCKAKV